jgi:hypothetical protein
MFRFAIVPLSFFSATASFTKIKRVRTHLRLFLNGSKIDSLDHTGSKKMPTEELRRESSGNTINNATK